MAMLFQVLAVESLYLVEGDFLVVVVKVGVAGTGNYQQLLVVYDNMGIFRNDSDEVVFQPPFELSERL